MDLDNGRGIIGVLLILIGVFGLAMSQDWGYRWSYHRMPWRMHPMMGWMGWRGHRDLEEVRGVVKKVEWMEVELEVDGREIEVHGPPWFWQRLQIEPGDILYVKGVFVQMMEHGESWHLALIPFEITLDDVIYGDADEGVPIWMQ